MQGENVPLEAHEYSLVVTSGVPCKMSSDWSQVLTLLDDIESALRPRSDEITSLPATPG